MITLRKRNDGTLLTEQQFRAEHPNTSFPTVINYAEHDLDVVFPAPQPEYNPLTHYIREVAPVLTQLGQYQQAWEVVALDAETVAANLARAQAQLIAAVTSATQSRLDDFAKTRNYDGILSACTYATSSVPTFAAEGQSAVNARDQTWAALYAIMAEVQAGTRPMPTAYADVEPELPVLTWPM